MAVQFGIFPLIALCLVSWYFSAISWRFAAVFHVSTNSSSVYARLRGML